MTYVLKSSLAVLFFCFVSLSYSQKEYKTYYDNGNIKETGYLDANGKATGEWKMYHENGGLEKIGQCKNSAFVGEWVFYDKEGNLAYKLDYTKNYMKTYRIPSGKLRSEGRLNYDLERHGKWKSYFENGKVQSEGAYYTDKKSGSWKRYWENGNVKNQGEYKADKKTGFWKRYYENGNLKSEGTYELNKPKGEWKDYRPSGGVESIYNYVNGEFHGEITHFYENGNLREVSIYENGIKIKSTVYSENGIISFVFVCDNNGKPIKVSYYYESGKIMSEGPVEDYSDNKVGKWKHYYEDGSLKSEGTYESNIKNGEWSHMRKNGDLQRKNIWVNGKIEESTWICESDDFPGGWSVYNQFYNQNLKKLEVHNFPDKGLPHGLEKLSTLEELRIVGKETKISMITSDLDQLPNLKTVEIHAKNVTEIPASLLNSKSIESLTLECQMTTLPLELGNMTNLKELVIINNTLDALPSSISKLKNLRKLDLCNSSLATVKTMVLPSELTELYYLEEICIRQSTSKADKKVRKSNKKILKKLKKNSKKYNGGKLVVNIR
jgi:antitoxin component YwqK of YwqJK toxin-antitoxin module